MMSDVKATLLKICGAGYHPSFAANSLSSYFNVNCVPLKVRKPEGESDALAHVSQYVDRGGMQQFRPHAVREYINMLHAIAIGLLQILKWNISSEEGLNQTLDWIIEEAPEIFEDEEKMKYVIVKSDINIHERILKVS